MELVGQLHAPAALPISEQPTIVWVAVSMRYETEKSRPLSLQFSIACLRHCIDGTILALNVVCFTVRLQT
jgi:hypothetical protein